jgi:hypothetical protein
MSTVGTSAKWTVEGNTASPTLRRWKAFSRRDVQPPMRFGEGPVPHSPPEVGRIHDADRRRGADHRRDHHVDADRVLA